MPCVSVIIPTHNRRALLFEAIESVRRQTFPDFEVIVVDDGSTDDTATAVAALPDSRLRYVYQDNAGLSAARNHGLAVAHGEFLAFLDDDDLFLPRKLETQVRELRLRPDVGLTVGGWNTIAADGTLLSEVPPNRSAPLDLEGWLLNCPFIVHAPLLRRSWAERIGGFDPQIRFSEDWDYWLRLAHAGCQMAWGSDIVCSYRLHAQTLTTTYSSDRTASLPIILQKYFTEQPNIPAPILAQKPRFLGRAYVINSLSALQFEDHQAAAERMAAALCTFPSFSTSARQELADLIANLEYAYLGVPKPSPTDVITQILPPALRGDKAFLRQLTATRAKHAAAKSRGHAPNATVRSLITTALRYDPRWACHPWVLRMFLETLVADGVIRNARRIASILTVLC